jgi:hypothetical protein
MITRERPTLPQWTTAFIVGGLLCTLGNGTVSWSERIVPSGIAALLVATVSLWMVLVDWLRAGGVRPPPRVVAGFFLGFTAWPCWWGQSIWETPSVSIPSVPLHDCRLAGMGHRFDLHSAPPVASQTAFGSRNANALRRGAAVRDGRDNRRDASFPLQRCHKALLVYLAACGTALGFSLYTYILKHSTASRVPPMPSLIQSWRCFLGGSLPRNRFRCA